MIRCFRESPRHEMPPVHLAEGVYAKATAALIFMCVDMVIVDRRQKTIFLAKRRHRPMSGRWWFIGGRRRAGESIIAGAYRCFARETQLRLTLDRFSLIAEFEYQFVDREQKPTNVGTHTRADIFAVELSAKEREQVRLDPEEYEGKLREFTRKDLRVANIPKPLLETYDLIFEL